MTTSGPTNDKVPVQWVSATDLPACAAPDSAILSSAELKGLIARAEAQDRLARPDDKPCRQQLAISFFFDGTGNNKDEDEPRDKTSNVARLFETHIQNQSLNIMRVYIPGVGTPFPEVGDKGGTLGDAFGKGGEKRINYAMAEFARFVEIAEAQAHNPTNKIIGIHVAIFGFSRGATEARAFALRLHRRLEGGGATWRLRDKLYPLRIYFMGLFDTVASVGFSNTMRNPEKRRALKGAGVVVPVLGPLAGPALVDAVLDHSETLKGHNGWAAELRIPPSVEQCFHYTAAHEVRESFPLDTVRVAVSSKAATPSIYPAGCTEVVYPGMHSDVGGGYAPSEQGRSSKIEAQLSQVPLLHMYRKAMDAGVPLSQVKDLPEKTKLLFQLCPRLSGLFDHYTAVTDASGSVEQQNARHLYWYYCWRKLRATTDGDPYLNDLEQRRSTALARQKQHEKNITTARPAMLSVPNVPVAAIPTGLREHGARYQQETVERQAILNEEYRQRKARQKEAEEIGRMESQIREEDERFINDCRAVEQRARSGRPLSLYEKTLLAAWQAPLVTDAKIIEFFDFHVHDSVAGFRATGAGYVDNSRAARPRDVYQGREPMT